MEKKNKMIIAAILIALILSFGGSVYTMRKAPSSSFTTTTELVKLDDYTVHPEWTDNGVYSYKLYTAQELVGVKIQIKQKGEVLKISLPNNERLVYVTVGTDQGTVQTTVQKGEEVILLSTRERGIPRVIFVTLER